MNAEIRSIATAVGRHEVDQVEARSWAERTLGSDPSLRRYLRVFERSGVNTRSLCLEPSELIGLGGPAERARSARDLALGMASEAAAKALAEAGCDPHSVDAVIFVSSTAPATPSLDASLVGSLGLRGDVRREATFGHGCAGGVGGLARAARLATSGSVVLLVVAEVCSLLFRPDDRRPTNVVAASLFADGAAALVLGPASSPSGGGSGLCVVGAGSTLWPETDWVMGFDADDLGPLVVLDPAVPRLVRRGFAESAAAACSTAGWDLADIDDFLLHPGGAAVLDALEDALDLGRGKLAISRSVLADHGNMSAPTALFVLERWWHCGPAVGRRALVSAMGPGFAAEHVLLTT